MRPNFELHFELLDSMAAPTRFMNSIYPTYPDDQSSKEVWLQAAGHIYTGGDRHVLIWWANGAKDNESPVIQIIQLSGQSGNYSYYVPVAQVQTENFMANNLQISLGNFTREQRDRILTLAKNVKYHKNSVMNGCRVWTRDLMEVMQAEALIPSELYTYTDESIPLVHRRAELE